ncbi:MICOS complex subunit MIC27-like [Protopterus annectens]|uniref:MICOS complex subunit MIC27-like n=1 Tax=Protopterus annectens TaxID=7888 RepID=UPI001CFAA946|nr:MICOS complex subunit MIC27-like [Protopterus annectens]
MFVEEHGHVKKGFSAIRQTFHPFTECYKGICNSAKNGVLNTVYFGQDSYSFIKNPPEGFLPRITVCGFAGVVLARKGSRFKKVIYPLGLTTLGVSLCYPAQAVVVAKVTGQNVYAASHWTYRSIRSLWEKSSANKNVSTAPLATKSALDLKAPPEESPEKLNGPVLTTTSENALQKDESVQMRNNILQDHEQSAAIKTATVTPSYFQSLSTNASLVSKSVSSPV